MRAFSSTDSSSSMAGTAVAMFESGTGLHVRSTQAKADVGPRARGRVR